MRVVRAAGQNVSPSDDGRLFDQIFSDGLFTDTTFTNLGGNSVQVGAMYGDLCGRDFTIEQMTLTVTLPEGEGEVTGYIYVEIDTSSDDVITLNSALAPFTPTYEDINTNGAIAQMILAEYTATAVAVTGVTPVYERAAASAVKAGSIATVESAQATQNHAVGDYVLLNGQLYVVTAAVNTGETFVEGTNISAAVIGDALTALNTGLTDELYYKSGDSYSTTNYQLFTGYISSSSKSLFFSVILPKRIPAGMTLSVSGKCAIRHVGGGYLVDGDINSAGTVSLGYMDNVIRVQIDKSTAFGATNNTPISVQPSGGTNGLTFTFN